MKPTQQEIIDVAREAGIVFDERAMPYYERLVHLVLERFGAGGGEQVTCDGDFPEGFNASLGIPAQALRTANAIMFDVIGKREWDVPCTAQHLLSFVKRYTHPSPTDLRAEYLRGLEDGFKEGWIECSKWAHRDDLIADIGSPSYEACVSAVKALKGKQ